MSSSLWTPRSFWGLMNLPDAKVMSTTPFYAMWGASGARSECGTQTRRVTTLLERLREPYAVKAVSMDMSASYRPAVQLCLPKAQIVVDHFHVIQLVMKGFRKCSRAGAQERREALTGRQTVSVSAGTRRSQRATSSRARADGEQLPLLELAWQLKEELRTWLPPRP